MKKKKVLKIIGMIILVVIIMFLIYVLRNFIIIKKLKNNFSKYENSQNYHITSVVKSESDMTVKMNYYKKENKQVVFMERKTSEEDLKFTMYDNGERVDIFIDNGSEKTCRLGVGTELVQVNLVNYLETDNDWQTFLASIFTRIYTKEFNQKKCYVIDNFSSPLFTYDDEKNEVYLEKETGLMMKSIFGDSETVREYEFDNVSDLIFAEPNIGEYRILTD